jgi:hypothetical protein
VREVIEGIDVVTGRSGNVEVTLRGSFFLFGKED